MYAKIWNSGCDLTLNNNLRGAVGGSCGGYLLSNLLMISFNLCYVWHTPIPGLICLSNCFNRPEEVHHVTVMPCYDKKLEASRDDFVFQLEPHADGSEGEVNMISEVDSVLTTGEILELIQVRKLYAYHL
jgi:hypothetical protein